MPEGVEDSGEARRDAPIVFVSDASAEAERLTQALRTRGYSVADVPLALLVGRIAVQRPALVICDADADDAVSILEKTRDASGPRRIPVVLLGERGGTIERVEGGLVVAAFARPVNVQELLGTVVRLVGAPDVEPSPASMPPSTRGKVAASSRPPGRSGPASVAPSRERPIRAEVAPSPAAIPLPPDLAGDAAPKESSDAPVVELSHAMQVVLAAAERRFSENRPPVSTASDEGGPEGEDDAPIPPEVLEALDEPLDEEDTAEEGSSPERGNERTGEAGGTRLGAHGHTRAGRTGSMMLGGEGTEAPDSQGSLPPPRPAGTAIQGPVVEMPPLSHAPPAEPDEKAARQRASTPKPPRPGPSEAPSPPGSASPGATHPGDAQRRAPTTPPSRPSLLPREPTGAGAGLEPDVRELTSTTPPVHRRDPAEERTPADRKSERPAASLTRFERPGDLPEPASEIGKDPARTTHAAQNDAPRSGFERPSEMPSPTRRERPSEMPPAEPDVRASSGDDRRGPARQESIDVPAVLRPGDTILVIARAIRARFSGALALEVDEGIRRIVFREGDFVTVASGVHGESLVAFLASRGDIPADVARQAHKLPAFGRRAGAALIAQGHLAQDQLWSVLRGHAEWLVGRACRIQRGGAGLEDRLIDRLQDEPAVFGGATGAEVLVDVVRRVVPPEEAMERLGGPEAVVADGPARALLGECALPQADAERIQGAAGRTITELVETSEDPSLVAALYALSALGVISTAGSRARPAAAPKKPPRDRIDDDALRARILARKALVDEGDYFALLGVPRDATGYDIRRAYSSLRKEFEPTHVLTAATADLGDTVTEIALVLEEAYEVLGDQQRRDRYLRAIEAVP